MQGDDRKAALAAYKEQKTIAGIYAVRCLASGEIWVGQTPNLDKIQNRLWFSLRHGGHSSRSLQAAWHSHGADSFAFETLERLEADETAYTRNAQLKARVGHWRTTLGAQAA